MKHEYRVVKVAQSNGPHHQQQNSSNLGTEGQEREIWVQESEPRRNHVILWILGIAAVALIVIMAVWMTGVSSSLAHTNQVVTQNSQGLSHMSNQLSGIQAALSAIKQQLNQLQMQINNFFTATMNYLTHHG